MSGSYHERMRRTVGRHETGKNAYSYSPPPERSRVRPSDVLLTNRCETGARRGRRGPDRDRWLQRCPCASSDKWPPGFEPASFCRDYFTPGTRSRAAADQVCSPEDRETLDATTRLTRHLIEACTLTLTRAQQSARADFDPAAAASCLLARRRAQVEIAP